MRHRTNLPKPPQPLVVWFVALKRRHVKVLIAHPHHYITAAGLTVFLFAIGHFEAGAIWGAWGYALVENLSTAAEAGA